MIWCGKDCEGTIECLKSYQCEAVIYARELGLSPFDVALVYEGHEPPDFLELFKYLLLSPLSPPTPISLHFVRKIFLLLHANTQTYCTNTKY
jgi:hypothetical protein